MFRPTDSGLKFPLKWKNYQGRVFITSNDGYELFKMETVINSLDGRQWLEEWAEWICKKSVDELNGVAPQDKIDEINKKIDEKVSEDIKNDMKKPSEKWKKQRGRPKGSRNK